MINKRERQFLGVDSDGALVFFGGIPEKGAPVIWTMEVIPDKNVEEMNSLEYVTNLYGYLYDVAKRNGNTDGMCKEEYMQSLIDASNDEGNDFFGQDPAYDWESHDTLHKLHKVVKDKVSEVAGVEDIATAVLHCSTSRVMPLQRIDTYGWKYVNMPVVNEINVCFKH